MVKMVFHLVFHMVKPPFPTYHINMPVLPPGEYGADAFNAKISGEDQDAQPKRPRNWQKLVDGAAVSNEDRWIISMG